VNPRVGNPGGASDAGLRRVTASSAGLRRRYQVLSLLQPELPTSKYGRGGFEFDGNSGSLEEGRIPEDDITYDLDAGKQGFDGFAIDNDGNLVVIKTKVKRSGLLPFGDAVLDVNGWCARRLSTFHTIPIGNVDIC